ncbi:MAG: DNA integrity scanning protein DisA nucleotide-binding domain protein [Candidatus Izemoplasmatales bacterium]|jgi:diadenylate cyclase|nr:DNA integrity scanning protein DisA nucleotide-binding domain protein [Candidatus Izemoplasmatales bacterium]MDD3865509.1 DNA integrity scanning protein DisA nucleotide-binding domain protein [Candidatus Izemoplasmatales bacterium]
MGNFEIIVLVSYLYAIFLLVLRAKVSHKNIRWFKILLVMLFVAAFYYLIVDSTTSTIALAARIIVFIPLGYVIFVMFINELTTIFKRMKFLKKRSLKNWKTNNDLAAKLGAAIEFLASRKIGALISIERDIKLSGYVNKAVMIEAPVSSELLATIFVPTTPLHDGAVIIRDNSILCAKAYYPSTARTDLPLKFGTRHRAAIGISEQSDALTIVVSEETGYVSVTINRQIDYNVSKETLNLYFEKYLKIK